MDSKLKTRLKQEHGSLRKAAMKTGVNYFRISHIINGWRKPNKEDIEKLGIKRSELTELKKLGEA